MEQRDDLAVMIETLTGGVEGLKGEVVKQRDSLAKLRKDYRLQRLILGLIAVVIVALAVLGVFMIRTVYRANQAAHRAEQATTAAALQRQFAKSQCEEMNNGRAAQRKMWDEIIGISEDNPSPHLTPEQRQKQLDRFKPVLDEATRIQDCDALTNGEGGK